MPPPSGLRGKRTFHPCNRGHKVLPIRVKLSGRHVMTGEFIGGDPLASDREQMGRFLRYAFPLGLQSFTELPSDIKDEERMKPSSRHSCGRDGVKTGN